MKKRKLGIIGGSGIYQMEGFESTKWKKIKTSWGSPSDDVMTATDFFRAKRLLSCFPSLSPIVGPKFNCPETKCSYILVSMSRDLCPMWGM